MPLFEGFHNPRHLFPKFNPNPNLPLKYIPVILRILIAKRASLLIYESAVIAIIGLTFVSPRLPRNIKCPPYPTLNFLSPQHRHSQAEHSSPNVNTYTHASAHIPIAPNSASWLNAKIRFDLFWDINQEENRNESSDGPLFLLNGEPFSPVSPTLYRPRPTDSLQCS